MTKRRPGPSIVAFGEAVADLFAEPGGRAFAMHPGGASVNFAIVAARLGVKTAILAAVGDDPLGDVVARDLVASGVDVSWLARKRARTGVAVVVPGPGGEPRFLNYRKATADLELSARDVPAWPQSARWLVVGSTHAVLPDLARASKRAVLLARRSKAHVAVDLNARRYGFPSSAARRRALADLLGVASIVKASAPDLDALGFRTEAAAHRWLTQSAPHATLLFTRGHRGAQAVGPHGAAKAGALHGAMKRRGARAVVIDAAGAGDAFLAGVLATLVAAGAEPGNAAYCDPEIWTAALEVGHSLGAKIVSHVGGTTGAHDVTEERRRIAEVRRMVR